MNRQRIAQELMAVARELTARDNISELDRAFKRLDSLVAKLYLGRAEPDDVMEQLQRARVIWSMVKKEHEKLEKLSTFRSVKNPKGWD